ncbi:hypothetical protein [Lutispora saccharofermentans]|uniref:Uncharacterized protein n=1 Tax=Lutispora saccharofermentans TaxID=3024236 RepID=A0ABT1ND96_9FIRM|nr:hypothetical protein [Lutispora saccharofermentans]MCQ1528604.1 hypothetical protein [Lutispora saccharofermentans]
MDNISPTIALDFDFVDDSFCKVKDICGSKIKTNIFLFRNIANSHYMEIVKNYDDIIVFIEKL